MSDAHEPLVLHKIERNSHELLSPFFTLCLSLSRPLFHFFRSSFPLDFSIAYAFYVCACVCGCMCARVNYTQLERCLSSGVCVGE